MDYIHLSDSSKVIEGLAEMTRVLLADNYDEVIQTYVDVPTSLFVVEIAKRAEDNSDWFPRGKWATIQHIEGKIDAEISKALTARLP